MSYRAVLSRPGVLRPTCGVALASLPIGMLSLALLLFEQERSSLSDASLVVGVFGVATVVGIAVQGRLLDRHGPRRILPWAAVIQVVALSGLALASPPLPATIALAALAGAGEPQVGGALRALWPTLVPDRLRPAATALSSILFEVPVTLGPLVLAAVLDHATPAGALVLAGALGAFGTLLVVTSSAARGGPRDKVVRRDGRGTRHRRGALAAVVVVAVVQGWAVGFTQIACAVAASATGASSRAAFLYAGLSAGSLLGVVVYGRGPRKRDRRELALLLLGPGVALGVGAASVRGDGTATLVGLGVCVAAAGLLLGPLGVRCFLDAECVAGSQRIASASTTVVASGLAATAVGTALAGRLAIIAGATPCLVVAGVCLVGAAAVVWCRGQKGGGPGAGGGCDGGVDSPPPSPPNSGR